MGRKKDENYTNYQHVKRIGDQETEGLLDGTCYVFPKLDGTNAQAWFEDGQMHYGSRNRDITEGSDNAGFREAMSQNQNLTDLCEEWEYGRVFGEWLVPHTVKGYADDAWRKFYVFDMMGADGAYVSYETLAEFCSRYGVEYIQPLHISNELTYEKIAKISETNTFLMADQKIGEGVVIKNYDYRNRFGRQTWGKFVTAEFHELSGTKKQKMPKQILGQIENEVVDHYLTTALIEKTQAKIALEKGGWSSNCIGELIGRVWYDIVNEEIWNIVKRFKNPTINFKTLNILVTKGIKTKCPSIFQ